MYTIKYISYTRYITLYVPCSGQRTLVTRNAEDFQASVKAVINPWT